MTFGLLGNIAKPTVIPITVDLVAYLAAKKQRAVVHAQLMDWCAKNGARPGVSEKDVLPDAEFASSCDMIISLGGDGTMLSTARLVAAKGVPILGVNLGKLGFLAEVSVGELHGCLDDILAGHYLIEERIALEATAAT